jgi:hypothetical protein
MATDWQGGLGCEPRGQSFNQRAERDTMAERSPPVFSLEKTEEFP